ncbi:hypothetical protein [Pseudomonas phage vB_Pae_SG_WM_Sew_P3]
MEHRPKACRIAGLPQNLALIFWLRIRPQNRYTPIKLGG